jgi:hypothetical protein
MMPEPWLMILLVALILFSRVAAFAPLGTPMQSARCELHAVPLSC